MSIPTQEIHARHDRVEQIRAECGDKRPIEKMKPSAHQDRGTLLERLADLAAYARACESLGLTPKVGVLMRMAEGKS